MTPINWITQPFIVIDAWQAVGQARAMVTAERSQWVVVYRRHIEGLKWYVLTRDELEAMLDGKSAGLTVEEALRLREHLASEVFQGRLPTGSMRKQKQLVLASPNRSVVLDSKRGAVKRIGELATSSRFATKASSTVQGMRPKLVIAASQDSESAAISKRPLPKSNTVYTIVPVFFGTSRAQSQTSGDGVFLEKRDPQGATHLGRCHVAIPTSHGMGELESPKWYRLEFSSNPSKHVLITDTTVLDAGQYFAEIRKQILCSDERDAFVFIHGFNVKFEEAVRRTGQMAYDLGFTGAAITYSWPSGGLIRRFGPDSAAVGASAQHFEVFLRSVLRRAGVGSIHIIAHSMGNRALLSALQRLSKLRPKFKIRNVIFAAPDVDKEEFEQIVSQIHSHYERLTLYASSKDKAIQASRVLYSAPRAGEAGKNIVILPGVDTIDASTVDTDFLGHSYAMGDRFVLGDVFELLKRGTEPAKRFGLQKVLAAPDRSYWMFRR